MNVLLLAVLAALPYLRALGFAFVTWDDPQMITANPLVQHPSLAALSSFHMTSYQPLGWWLYAALNALGRGTPAAFHACSILLHALNAALLFSLLRAALTRGPKTDIAAALATLAWAWHPIQAESVAWASQLSDLLCATFVLAGLLVREREYPRLGLAAFALAGLCRWKALAYPVFALAWDLARERSLRRRLSEYVALAAIACAVIALNAAAKARVGYLPAFRPQEACVGLLLQASKIVFPWRLAPAVLMDGDDNPLKLSLFGASVVLLLVATSLAFARRNIRLAVTAFAAALLPAFGAAAGPVAAMDHHLYLPSLAFVPLSVAAVSRARPALRNAAAALVAVLGLAASAQTGIWRDSETLWPQVLAVHPLFPAARLNLAASRAQDGRAAGALLLVDEQLALYPNDVQARRLREVLLTQFAPTALQRARLESNAAAELLESGRPAAAAARMKIALSFAPHDPQLRDNAAVIERALHRPLAPK